MAEIARRAGVVRATIYVHFPTREQLIGAVTDRAIAEVTEALAAAEPERGEPAEALRRVLRVTWRELDRLHALVQVNATLSREEFHRRHLPFLERIAPLLERGRASGVFRADLPVSWHLAMLLAVVHAASGEVHAGRIGAAEVEPAMIAAALGALAAPA
jgi:AcrR family transcriptional regulator